MNDAFWSCAPVVRNQRWRSGLPLGGLGCGKLELLTDGSFGKFTINHNWDRPTGVVRGAFLGLRRDDTLTLLRLHRPGEYAADAGRAAGIARLANVPATESVGLFPRARVRFDGLPVEVTLEAFCPLIPGNIDDSALPVALLTVTLRSAADTRLGLLLSWENLLGVGGRRRSLGRASPVVRMPGEHHGDLGVVSAGVRSAGERVGLGVTRAKNAVKFSHHTDISEALATLQARLDAGDRQALFGFQAELLKNSLHDS